MHTINVELSHRIKSDLWKMICKKNDDSIIEFELFDVGQRRLRNMGIL